MKKIIIILLTFLTFSAYGQAEFEKIAITENVTSATATKVNVQENNGVINTIAKADLIDVVYVTDTGDLPVTGVAGKIYGVTNTNNIYRWAATFYQELAVTDISGKENISNKATDFSTVNNTLYPSVQAVKTQLDLKAPIASPTFTGTVSGITKTMVGLSNVDNTSDVNKNVNSANLWNSYSDASHDANLGYMMGYNGTTSKFSYYGISTVKTWLEGAGTWGINISGSSTNWGTAGNTYIDADNGNSNYIMVTTGGTGQWRYRSITDFRSDLGAGGMILGTAQTNTGVKTFLDGTLGLRNVADTFTSYFTNTDTASRTYTLQNRNGILADDTDLALKANLASPSLTGTPTAPTASAGTNTTQIATTAFVLANAGGGGGDMVLASAQTNSGVKTFLDGTLGLRNVANTFTSYFTNTDTASRTRTFSNRSYTVAGTDETILLTGTQTATGRKNFSNTGDAAVYVTNSTSDMNGGLVVLNSSTGRGFNFLNQSSGQGGILQNQSTGQGLRITNSSTGDALTLESTSTGSGVLLKITKNSVLKASVTETGLFNVGSLISDGIVRLKNYTVATLPAGTQGDTAYCTDLLTPTYMTTAVGGGTVVWKVFYDGTTWKVD